MLECLLGLLPGFSVDNGRNRSGDPFTLFLTPLPVDVLSFIDLVDDQVADACRSPCASRMLLALALRPAPGNLAIVLCISGWHTEGVQMFRNLDARPPFVGQ